MKQGFTLIELLVVVLIIGILSAVALPQYQTAVERSRATEALTMMAAISDSSERYHAQHEAWPATNNFNKLDVDIPSSTSNGSTVYGGKYFTIGFGTDTGANDFGVYATRKGIGYMLITKIDANADGSYRRTRSCDVSNVPQAKKDDATDYCNAISGGNPTNF